MTEPSETFPTDDPCLDDDALIDGIPVRDWRAIVAYASGAATPSAAAQLTQRLQTDPPLAAVAGPILLAWEMSVTPLGAAHPVAIMDKAAGWAIVQRKAAALQAARMAPPGAPSPSRTPSHWPGVRSWRTLQSVAVALAASLLIAVGLHVHAHTQHPGLHYHATRTALTVTLPDGSHATLAPGAYLGTSPTFSTRAGARAVYLFGAARFAVAPDPSRPFTVRAIGLRATALGTKFDLDADTLPRFAVHVLQGRVALDLVDATGHTQRVAILSAGDVHQVSALAQWFVQAGYIVGQAGVPFAEARQLNDALLRAAAEVAARP